MLRAATCVLTLAVLLTACGGGDGTGRIAFDISLQNLPALGPEGGTYQGWAVVGGIPLTTGKFRIVDSVTPPIITNAPGTRTYGTTVSASFGPANTLLGEAFPFIVNATFYFITVEPEGDLDFIPSGNRVLEGPFVGSTAVLAPTGFTSGDLTTAAGSGLLITPTDTTDVDANGLWFVTDATGTPALSLPALTGRWRYEGWVTDGVSTFSTGMFVDAAAPDDDASISPTRGDQSVGFAAPGRDFRNATFVDFADVLDLDSGDWRVEVTVEPFPDNDPAPFPLLLLEADVPVDAVTTEKVTAQDVLMAPPASPLPEYDATITATTVDLVAPAPNPGLGTLGIPRNGHWQLWAVLTGVPQAIVRFVIDPVTGDALELQTMTSLGTAAAIQLDTVNVPGLPDLTAAEEMFITVEFQGDPLPTPSDSAVVAGAIMAGIGTLDVQGLRSVLNPNGRGVANFSSILGAFILNTPTDDLSNPVPNDHQGVWFVAFANRALPTLVLPILPLAWHYEAWVVNTVTASRWSVGRLRNPINADFDAATWVGRGSDSLGFISPGQDFVTSVQPGTFVDILDLNGGWSTMISIEPFPDSSPAPFFTLLTGALPTAGTVVAPFTNEIIANPDSLPSGIVSFDDP